MSPADLVRASRQAQGLPPTIENPETLATIARVLAAVNGNAGPRKARATATTSDTTATPTPEGGSHG